MSRRRPTQDSALRTRNNLALPRDASGCVAAPDLAEPLGVHLPHAPQTASEMPLADEVAQHRLVVRIPRILELAVAAGADGIATHNTRDFGGVAAKMLARQARRTESQAGSLTAVTGQQG